MELYMTDTKPTVQKTLMLRKFLFTADIAIILFLCIYLILQHMNSNKDLPKALKLENNEVLIDYAIGGAFAYTLTNKDGNREYGNFFVVFEKADDEWQRVYENDFKNLMPWKVETADIDGDGIPEILTALRKKTPYDREIKNRMFIFNYEDNKLIRKWTGSQIAGIWRDFYVMDFLSPPGYELLFVEQTYEGKERVSVYSWFDFGFHRLAYSDGYEIIQNISMVSENRLKITYREGKKEYNVQLETVNGKLVPKQD